MTNDGLSADVIQVKACAEIQNLKNVKSEEL